MGGIAVGSLPCVPLESPANPKIPVVGLVVESGALPADLEGTVKGGPTLLVDVVEEELLLLGPDDFRPVQIGPVVVEIWFSLHWQSLRDLLGEGKGGSD